nr:phospholipid phosphatase 6 [Nomia melanderi]
MAEEKRKISPWLQYILAIDRKLTENFVQFVEKSVQISCHGVTWIFILLASIWIFHSKRLYQIQVNLLIGILLDIIIIGLLKAFARRRRPADNDDPFAIGSDKYSFPSGHASRVMMIFYFFMYLWPVSVICFPPLVAWVIATPLSRLLMRRHYILDILAGLFIGYAEGILMSIIYLDSDTCQNFVSWITNVRVDEL